MSCTSARRIVLGGSRVREKLSVVWELLHVVVRVRVQGTVFSLALC